MNNKRINMEDMERVFNEARENALTGIYNVIHKDITKDYNLNEHASMEVFKLNIKKQSRDLFGKMIADGVDIFKINDRVINMYYEKYKLDILKDFNNIITIKIKDEFLYKGLKTTKEKKEYKVFVMGGKKCI